MGNCSISCANDSHVAPRNKEFVTDPDYEEDMEQSALKIQAHYRGVQARKKYKEAKRESIALTENSKDPYSAGGAKTHRTTYIETTRVKTQESVRSNYKFIDNIPPSQNKAVQEVLAKLGPFDYSQHKELVEEFLGYPIFHPIQLDNGVIYAGQWSEQPQPQGQDLSLQTSTKGMMGAVRHGKGKQIWPDGSIYEGFWRNDKAEGYGRLIHADGDYYEGEWRNDKAHGKGRYEHPNGTFYQGDWVCDVQEGLGIEKYIDGSVFEGRFLNGVKNGEGQFRWLDGSTYTGMVKNNKFEGKGHYEWANGRTYEGEWADSKMNGYGVFTWRDGRKYEGHYKDDKKEGYGVYLLPDGRKYEGEWKNGLQHGKGRMISKDGKIRVGVWSNGKRVQWEASTESDAIESPRV